MGCMGSYATDYREMDVTADGLGTHDARAKEAQLQY